MSCVRDWWRRWAGRNCAGFALDLSAGLGLWIQSHCWLRSWNVFQSYFQLVKWINLAQVNQSSCKWVFTCRLSLSTAWKTWKCLKITHIWISIQVNLRNFGRSRFDSPERNADKRWRGLGLVAQSRAIIYTTGWKHTCRSFFAQHTSSHNAIGSIPKVKQSTFATHICRWTVNAICHWTNN